MCRVRPVSQKWFLALKTKHAKKGKGDKMSAYQDGYDKGKEHALDGRRNIVSGGLVFEFLSEISNDKDQDDWEEGYTDGYEAGEEELEEKKEEEDG
jgi:hypothetical protein